MCGILGSPNITDDVRRMLPFLGLAMEDRGHHSWGASDGHVILRHLGPLHESWGVERETIDHWSAGIFHTRAASVGAHDRIENAHPFRSERADGGAVIGIHNGGISNHKELAIKYSRSDFEVDSQHLWAHRAAGLSWKELRGGAALAWWEISPQLDDGGRVREMYITRINTTALELVRVGDGGLVFASTYSGISLAAAMAGTKIEEVWKITEGDVLNLSASGEVFNTGEKVKFGSYQVSTWTGGTQRAWVPDPEHPERWIPQEQLRSHNIVHVPAAGAANSITAPDNGGCWKCGHPTAITEYLLCKDCFTFYVEKYKREESVGGPVLPLLAAAFTSAACCGTDYDGEASEAGIGSEGRIG